MCFGTGKGIILCIYISLYILYLKMSSTKNNTLLHKLEKWSPWGWAVVIQKEKREKNEKIGVMKTTHKNIYI